MNIAVVTFDSLRFDVAANTQTPNFKAIFKKYGAGRWRKVFSQTTFTLPSHISLLQGAISPSNFGNEPVYNRRIMGFFNMALPWRAGRKGLYELDASANVVKGFEKKGYRTVGIGGVGWFSTKYKASNFWKGQFFQEFYWDEKFCELNDRAFENQIAKVQKTLHSQQGPLFFFINVPTTHIPYRGEERSKEGQGKAFQYLDKHFPKLLELLPKPCHFLLWSDHGECFGENNLWGHGFFHKKIIEVPMIHFIVR